MLIKISQLSRRMIIFRTVLLILIGMNIAFIFSQSALPPQVVEDEVEMVKEVIGDILPSESEVAEFTESNTDKIAHFVEFGVLGALVSTFVLLYTIKPVIFAPLSVIFAGIVAIIDETIQIFSGRCPDIADFCLDVLGFFCISTIIYTAFFTVRYFKRKKEL